MSTPTHPEPGKLPGLPPIDTSEYGGKKEGERQTLNRRLFMQLLVFDVAGGSADAAATTLARLLRERGVPSVVYADAMAPSGLGLLTWHEDPAHFVRAVRPVLGDSSLPTLVPRPAFTMIGRTYSLGHEPELEHALLRRPVEYVSNDGWPWHVWYPLRRLGAFNRLEPAEQSVILREHATIGFAYGQADLGHDVRLACHGLDAEDNEFVIGLVGKELYPLSHLVQTMRKTRQTSEFIAKMGPFFVGFAQHRTG
jgi:chlorite dismutase